MRAKRTLFGTEMGGPVDFCGQWLSRLARNPVVEAPADNVVLRKCAFGVKRRLSICVQRAAWAVTKRSVEDAVFLSRVIVVEP